MHHFTKQNYAVSQWSGGTTTQIAIYPPNALYADRDFLWRLSSATVDLDESDFTPLPDYQRWITVLEGSMTLTHDGGASITLVPGTVHEFDGASATRSVGRCTDFNLMLRKGKCQGALRALPLPAGGSREIAFELPHSTILVFCCTGGGTVSAAGEALHLAPYESALLEETSRGVITLKADERSLFIVAEMQF